MVVFTDVLKDTVVLVLISVLLGITAASITTLIKVLHRSFKHYKYKSKFPEIIVDDGYGDIHRTIYPEELLVAKLFSTTLKTIPAFQEALHGYYTAEMHAASKIKNKDKRRKYERITVLNIMTIIRREVK